MVTFGPKKVKDRNVGKMTVRGKGWDATVGGWWFDLKLTDVFADGFNAKVCFQYCCRILYVSHERTRLAVSFLFTVQLLF